MQKCKRFANFVIQLSTITYLTHQEDEYSTIQKAEKAAMCKSFLGDYNENTKPLQIHNDYPL